MGVCSKCGKSLDHEPWGKMLCKDCAPKKRLYLHILQKYDYDHDKSIVREIEMHVDAVLLETGYSIQFWTDVQTYGLQEALLFLKNQKNVHRGNDSKEMKDLEAVVIVVSKLFC